MCTCVMQASPINSTKNSKNREDKTIHALIMKKIDEYQSSLREEPPYTMYCVSKTTQYTMLTNMKVSPSYIYETYVYNNN